MYCTDMWQEYALIDCGNGEKYERWGDVTLLRPDPQAIWTMGEVGRVDAHYVRAATGGGNWQFNRSLPESWKIKFNELTFIVHPTGFKHTGLFPEQAVNWLWMQERIRSAAAPVRVLNLFGYTGGATCACLSAGASVCHVDAAKGMVAWAKDNVAASGLQNGDVRYIVDDCEKFVLREARRGKKYDAILMDPPSYGRGPNGEMWKLEDNLFSLVSACAQILQDNPLFFLINSYTTGLAPTVLKNILQLAVGNRHGGSCMAGEVVIPAQARPLQLPCGASGRWQAQSGEGDA